MDLQSAKKIPVKILVILFICSAICIAGQLISKLQVDRLTQGYELLMNEKLRDFDYISQLNALLRQHYALVCRHISCNSDERMEEYEQQMSPVEDSIENILKSYGEVVKGTDKEEYYHNVYSNYYKYLNNAEYALHFSRNGNNNTAEYYINDVLDEFINEFKQNLQTLSDMTNTELEQSKLNLSKYITISKISVSISITCIVLTLLTCLLLCFNMLKKLAVYNDNLKTMVDERTTELQNQIVKMEELQNNTIVAVANLIENRDGETGEHVKRTSSYVEILAKAAQSKGLYTDTLTDEYIDLLVEAAPLHDIGKISVADRILKKPGKLTPEEFEEIKLHASEGGEIIRSVFGNIEEKKYVDMAAEVAAYHHEKWNGQGYPNKLSGEEIPLCARIMAISDVFDALVSKRCYKDALPIDVAFKIIDESAGNHFDPVLAKTFIECRPQIENVLYAKE